MNRITRNRPIVVGWVIMMTLATIVLAGATLIIGSAQATQASRNARDEAIRQSVAAGIYNDCAASIPTLRAVSTHISGVNDLANLLVENSKRSLRALPRSAPDYRARQLNILGLEKARAKIATVKTLTVPSLEVCAARRNLQLAPKH